MAGKGLELSVDEGSYSVSIDGKVWFSGDQIWYMKNHTKLSTKDGSLKLDFYEKGSGSDATGAFESTRLTWDEGRFVTTFRKYADAIVFEQSFPLGVSGTSHRGDPYSARDSVSSCFPVISGGHVTSDNVGFLAFAGDMTGSSYVYGKGMKPSNPYSGFPSGVSGTGPVGFFDSSGTATAVMSSFSQFMAASSQFNTNGTDAGLHYGVQGSVTEFPAGYSLSFILSVQLGGGSVNQAFEAWGDKLLGRYNKDRAVTYRDYALNYLGYSTDNGAFYYYNTEGQPAGKRGPPYEGKSYQDTLIDVKKYADAEGIPYKYVLLDSWWYYQGVGSGVSNWIGRPDVFPKGNSYVRNATGWPIMGHNRY